MKLTWSGLGVYPIIQPFASFIIEIAELISLALNAAFLFLELTQLEQWSRQSVYLLSFFVIAMFQVIITLTTLLRSVVLVDGKRITSLMD